MTASTLETGLSPVSPAERRIVRLEEGCRALAEARSIEDVKEIRDQAQAMAQYVKERGLGIQAQNDAAELKLRAERRIGELLPAVVQHGGDRKTESRSHGATLNDLGLTKNDSSRFQQVASMTEELFESYVEDTRERGEELTSAGARRAAKKAAGPGKRREALPEDGCTVNDLHALVAQGKRYGTIYADPAWPYDNQATRGSTDDHYPTMSLEDMAALPVKELALPDSHCHMWTTNGFLRESFDLLAAWGFTYKSCFVWVKPQMGMGNYWRVSHELMLLGVRGKVEFADHGIISWVHADRGKHSAKPGQIRALIERVSPGPYLELFGRLTVPNWAVWGNQVSKDLFNKDHQQEEER